jgi:DNA-binding LacI/PurR family transcriptional regulator
MLSIAMDARPNGAERGESEAGAARNEPVEEAAANEPADEATANEAVEEAAGPVEPVAPMEPVENAGDPVEQVAANDPVNAAAGIGPETGERSTGAARGGGRGADSDKPRKPTLRHVARDAGVSLGTASNAFNRPDLISEALRDRVFESAARLGYGGPDPAARRLRTGRAGALGLIFTDRLPYAFDDAAAVLFLRGVANALENSGAGLLLIPTPPTREEGSRVVRGAAVDGFIVFAAPTGDPRLEAALARGLPTVTVDEPLDVPTSFIGVDERGGAEAAARHLVELGHERVAVVSFPEYARIDRALPFDVPRERLAGYRAGLGRLFDPQLVLTADSTRADTARRVFSELLELEPVPTAVLAMSDAYAAGIVRAAVEAGLRVPADLSVVGFDDVPIAELTDPPLTTVAQPLEHKGELAAQALIHALEEQEPAGPRKTFLPTDLVVRGTTAARPG